MKYSSSASSIISIDDKGLLTAVAPGSASLTVTSVYDEEITYTSNLITVKAYVGVTGLEIDKASTSVRLGGFKSLDVAFSPSDASYQNYSCSSDNESVMKVNEKGLVTCLGPGSATIMVTSKDNPEVHDSVLLTALDGYDDYEIDTHVSDKIKMQGLKNTQGCDAIPGKGKKTKLLAIPVEFSDYPFSSSIKSDINTLCNGNNEDGTTGYWESISYYYRKSSYGNLDFSVTVGDVYRPINSATEKQYKTSDLKTENYTKVWEFLRGGVNAYKAATASSCKEFDSDGNGFIDAVYLIYSAPDYMVDDKLNSSIFWAWAFWDSDQSPSYDSPTANNFFWASSDFMKESGDKVIDAHTFIHETGHLLGANDYYSYNYKSNKSPIGGIDIMDSTIGDHNMWTKMSYGWVNPIVVKGDARITIKSTEAQGDVILLAPDGWNGTSFDEMITLELSTPTGLNELDYKNRLANHKNTYAKPGVKALHVDSRIMDEATMNYADISTYSSSTKDWQIGAANTDDYDGTSSARNLTSKNFYQIGLIQEGGKATCLNYAKGASDDDLFHAGDSFKMSDYSEFFASYPTFNNGKKFPYQFYVESLSETEATIVIQKDA
jgi:M6 family metalloprotease-like protein